MSNVPIRETQVSKPSLIVAAAVFVMALFTTDGSSRLATWGFASILAVSTVLMEGLLRRERAPQLGLIVVLNRTQVLSLLAGLILLVYGIFT